MQLPTKLQQKNGVVKLISKLNLRYNIFYNLYNIYIIMNIYHLKETIYQGNKM